MTDRIAHVTQGTLDYIRQIWYHQHLQERAASGELILIFPETELVFPVTETKKTPDCFWDWEGGTTEFRGQEAAKARIDAHIEAVPVDGRIVMLLDGLAGIGKTTLAWIAAKKLRLRRYEQAFEEARFFELLPNQFENKAEFDVFMQQLQRGDIVFIDEVHVLKSKVGAEPLYHTLANTGSPRYPLSGGRGWVDVDPTVSWIAATTEPETLDDALLRRLEPRVRLEPPDIDTLIAIINDQPMPVHPDAAEEIALRAGNLPWQALLVLNECRICAVNNGASRIDPDHAEAAFYLMGLDENGLFPEHRAVVHALLGAPRRIVATGETIYIMSEEALCATAGVNKETYRRRIKPVLMAKKYLTIRSGQCLLPKAIEDYGSP